MGSFRPLFHLAVEHMFYSGALYRALEFVPVLKTSETINNTGVVVKPLANGVCVLYDEAKIEALQLHVNDVHEPLTLGLKAFATDPLFENYTEPSPFHSKKMLYFNNEVEKIDSEGSCRLHDAAYVSEVDFEALNSERLGGIVSERELRRRPVFVAEFHLTKLLRRLRDSRRKNKANNYFITFRAKKTYWKYYLLGDFAKKNTIIEDMDRNVEFSPTDDEKVGDERIAMTFTSKNALPLRYDCQLRLQLREKGRGRGKVLVKRLPVASARQTDREYVNGKSVAVSHIYVNC